MPLIEALDIDRMIAAFSPADQRSIVVPVHERTFGNPVLWGSEHFAALMACEGDRGARGLLEKLKEDAIEIPVDTQGILLDADTPEALAAIRSIAGS
jgi:molybdenum cofactor cytidylyltransferase